MYMNYCKFEGTLAELNACIADVEGHVNEDAQYPVSAREIDCFRLLVETVANFLADAELLGEYGEIDSVRLDEICEAMSHGYEETE